MTKDCENKYKICRENAVVDGKKLTQADAAERLFISIHQLSNYERGEAVVPDDMVDRMASLYNTPLLAWWHLKNYSILGKYLPEVPEPKTNGDMAFQSIITKDRYDFAVEKIKKIFADGVLKQDEREEFDDCLKDLRIVSSTTYVMALYGEQVKIEDAA